MILFILITLFNVSLITLLLEIVPLQVELLLDLAVQLLPVAEDAPVQPVVLAVVLPALLLVPDLQPEVHMSALG